MDVGVGGEVSLERVTEKMYPRVGGDISQENSLWRWSPKKVPRTLGLGERSPRRRSLKIALES